jgi:hypothetical protein
MRDASIIDPDNPGCSQVPRGSVADSTCWSLVAVAAFNFSRLAGSEGLLLPTAQKLGGSLIRDSPFACIVPCTIGQDRCPIPDRTGASGDGLARHCQRPGLVFTWEATRMVSMDRSRRARPNVLEHVLRAELLAMIGRVRGLRDTLVHFADMTSPPMRARTSLAMARIANPERSNSRFRLCRIALHREMNLPR